MLIDLVCTISTVNRCTQVDITCMFCNLLPLAGTAVTGEIPGNSTLEMKNLSSSFAFAGFLSTRLVPLEVVLLHSHDPQLVVALRGL